MLLESEVEIEIDTSKLEKISNIRVIFTGNEPFTGQKLNILQPYREQVLQLVAGGWYAKDALDRQDMPNLITRRAEFHGLCPWVNE